MVRPMLQDFFPACLSVTLVYYGPTVTRITMPLDTKMDLGPGNIGLDGDPAPPRKGAQLPPPSFRLMSIVTKRLDGSGYDLVQR